MSSTISSRGISERKVIRQIRHAAISSVWCTYYLVSTNTKLEPVVREQRWSLCSILHMWPLCLWEITQVWSIQSVIEMPMAV